MAEAMLNALSNESNITRTENGAYTYRSTGSECLDFFGTVGAIRDASDKEKVSRFIRAFSEDRDTALKTIFFARDIREGLGERDTFRAILEWLGVTEPEIMRNLVPYIPEYGRYDDLLSLLGTPVEDTVVAYIKSIMAEDLKNLEQGGEVSLLGKWLPSINTSSYATREQARHLASKLGMNLAEYRKTLSKLRAGIKIIENNLRTKDYTFDYSKQPSQALRKYMKAFVRNDGERYKDFIQKVQKGEAKLNASTLAPYQLVESIVDFSFCDGAVKSLSEEERAAIDATWKSLPVYGEGGNALAVVDMSGSMYEGGRPVPVTISISLGLYFAEHNKGYFKDHMILFSHTPKFIKVKGADFADKVKYIMTFCEVANTNIQAVFDLILNAAVKNRLPQEELPERLYIISDMEFDEAFYDADVTNFDAAKQKYLDAGYNLPEVIFWNVQSRHSQQPVKQNGQGVALVSGCSPAIFDMVASGNLDPMKVMTDILFSERYAPIHA
ncbi:MAG: DUF2828 family protein [Clostridia bacterium]|nr:DUF2828 family protein [Clostridia bacterium]